MIDCQKLAKLTPLYKGATTEELAEVQAALGYTFPPAYIELLICSNGFDYAPPTIKYGSVFLFPTSIILEYNKAYLIAEYTPTLLFIGLDGGGRGFFLDKETEEGAVYLLEMGVPFREEAIFLASNLEEWIENDFSCGEEDEDDDIDYSRGVDVYMVKPPTGGAKGLIDLKNFLSLTESIVTLRLAYQQLPYRLLRNVPFVKYAILCVRYNSKDPCLALFEVDQPDKPVEILESF